MLEWIVACAVATAVSAAVFVTCAVLWLRKLRETVSSALTDASQHQNDTAEQLSQALALVQKQQRTYEVQLHGLAQAGVKLRQDLASVSQRLEHADHEQHARDRTVH
jgi:succinyl-CoA synthetase alpha subunit